MKHNISEVKVPNLPGFDDMISHVKGKVECDRNGNLTITSYSLADNLLISSGATFTVDNA